MELHYPLEKQYPLTQAFGITPWSAAYQPYGLAGHSGVDIGCPAGTLVLAADDGTVERTDQAAGGYGLHVILRHSWGISLYAHLEGLFAQTGTTVRRGQPIARSGSSGNSTGLHLHFEIRPDGEVQDNGYNGAVDPLPFIPGVDGISPAEANPAGAGWTVTADIGLNLRRAPSLDGGRLGVLLEGTPVVVSAEQGDWRCVTVCGWVHGAYLARSASLDSDEGGKHGTV